MKLPTAPKCMVNLSKDFRRLPDFSEFVLLFFLVVAGLLGNHFNIELFFGVNFVFGSIASLLAVRVSGAFWGALADRYGDNVDLQRAVSDLRTAHRTGGDNAAAYARLEILKNRGGRGRGNVLALYERAYHRFTEVEAPAWI